MSCPSHCEFTVDTDDLQVAINAKHDIHNTCKDIRVGTTKCDMVKEVWHEGYGNVSSKKIGEVDSDCPVVMVCDRCGKCRCEVYMPEHFYMGNDECLCGEGEAYWRYE